MISDGVMAIRSFSLPSSLIADLGANKNMRLKGSDKATAPAALEMRRSWPDNAQSRSSSTIIRSMFVSFLAILTNASVTAPKSCALRSCRRPFEPSSFHRARASRGGSALPLFGRRFFRRHRWAPSSGAASVADGDGKEETKTYRVRRLCRKAAGWVTDFAWARIARSTELTAFQSLSNWSKLSGTDQVRTVD